MQIVVNDTNIFLDLINADLLDHFFQLPFEVHTTDFVISEIEEPDQTMIVQRLIDNCKLTVGTSTISELVEISEMQNQNGGLSIEDCSVWHYSKRNRFMILSGDGLLTKAARKDGLIVRGVLFVFDELVNQNVITAELAADKLELILLMGSRLPKKECDQRLQQWRNI